MFNEVYFGRRSPNPAQTSKSQDLKQEELMELQAGPEGWWPKGRTRRCYNRFLLFLRGLGPFAVHTNLAQAAEFWVG